MLSIVFRPTRTSIDTLQLDAAVSQTHEITSEITTHALENGEPVVDHVRSNPRKLTIEGIVSDTPLRWPSWIEPGRSKSAFAKLRELVRSGTPVDVITDLETYHNMVLHSLSVPRNSTTGSDGIQFTASLTEIRFAESEITSQADARGPKADLGDQPTDAASPALSEKFGAAQARLA